MKRKVEISFETEEVILFKDRRSFTAFCPFCAAEVQMMSPETAAALCEIGEREIFRAIESGEIHFVEAERIYVCQNSLVFFSGNRIN